MPASTVDVASVQDWEAINWDAPDLEKVVVTSSIIGTLDEAARRESDSNAKAIINDEGEWPDLYVIKKDG